VTDNDRFVPQRKSRLTRRKMGPADDDRGVSEQATGIGDPGLALLDLFDRALPQVYGYFVTRCGTPAVAEDLTAETFLAAVDAVRRDRAPTIDIRWLIGVARHKLVDHWRRRAREERGLRVVHDNAPEDEDPWEAQLDAMRARETLGRLALSHWAALTLRYVDDLPVADVAAVLDRSVHATEALLVRGRAAFRRAYNQEDACDG
jgi:RNA polymerase sigma-70 factor (ECF subfamily)